MVIGLVLGFAASAWVVVAARDHTLADALPSPWLTACLGLGVVAGGWVLTSVSPRFATALAGAAAPGAAYGAMALAGDGTRELAYGWSVVALSIAALAIWAFLHGGNRPARPWSARRASSPRVPRVRVR